MIDQNKVIITEKIRKGKRVNGFSQKIYQNITYLNCLTYYQPRNKPRHDKL